MAVLYAVHQATPTEALAIGVALAALGSLLLLFRKQVQAFNLALMNRKPEGKFSYVVTYIYGPAMIITIGLIVFLSGFSRS